MRRALCALSLILACHEPSEVLPDPLSAPAPASASDESMASMTQDPPEPEAVATATWDPYDGWERWCEPHTYDQVCKQDQDCAGIAHVARRPLRCIHTAQAKRLGLRDEDGQPLRFCAPGHAGPLEQKWRQARLRDVVAMAYFDEPKRCPAWSWEVVGKGRRARIDRVWANGLPTHRQHYRCQQEWRLAEKLAAFLWVPYKRETGARPWARHRLNPDLRANETAWVEQAPAYGWKMDLACDNGRKRCKSDRLVVANYQPDPASKVVNEHYGDRHRWQYGLGGYGKNTGYGVRDWDKLAPPEILCLEIQGTEAYLRDARHAVEVFRSSGVTCSGKPYRGRALVEGEWVDEPSWIDVHRVASGGKFCPTGRADFEARFRARMEAEDLVPDEPVTLEMLGREISRVDQNERAARMLAELERRLPPPWRAP